MGFVTGKFEIVNRGKRRFFLYFIQKSENRKGRGSHLIRALSHHQTNISFSYIHATLA